MDIQNLYIIDTQEELLASPKTKEQLFKLFKEGKISRKTRVMCLADKHFSELSEIMDLVPETENSSSSLISKNYFLYVDEEVQGPYKWEDIESKVLNKELSDGIYLAEEGTQDWIPYSQVNMLNREKRSTSYAKVSTVDESNKKRFREFLSQYKTIIISVLAVVLLLSVVIALNTNSHSNTINRSAELEGVKTQFDTPSDVAKQGVKILDEIANVCDMISFGSMSPLEASRRLDELGEELEICFQKLAEIHKDPEGKRELSKFWNSSEGKIIAQSMVVSFTKIELLEYNSANVDIQYSINNMMTKLYRIFKNNPQIHNSQ